MFSSIARFVLTVFDLEDFERIFDLARLIDCYTKFCRCLRELEPGHGGPAIAKMDMDKNKKESVESVDG